MPNLVCPMVPVMKAGSRVRRLEVEVLAAEPAAAMAVDMAQAVDAAKAVDTVTVVDMAKVVVDGAAKAVEFDPH